MGFAGVFKTKKEIKVNLLDPVSLISAGGYAAVFAVIFAETGLLVGFFLPGDTLLFAAGFLASAGYLNIAILIIVAFIAAALGDTFSYYLGRRYGHKVFKRQGSASFCGGW